MLLVAAWVVLGSVLLFLLPLLEAAWLLLDAVVARSLCFLVLLLLVLVLLAASCLALVAVVVLCLLRGEEVNQAEVVLVHLQGAARPPW